MPDNTNALVKVVAIFGVINRVPATTPAHNVFCYSAVAHVLTPSVNLAFRPKSGFKNKFRARAGFGLLISDSGRVQASKWSPFTTLCVYVCKGHQREIERLRPPPTNSKNRLKSFFEIGYVSVFQPFCCSGTFSKCLRCSWNPVQLWHSGTLLQPRRTVVANFVPGNFGLFRGNPWQPLAESRLKNTGLR